MIMRAIPVWIFWAALAVPQDPKPDPPGEEAQVKAEREIRAIFKDEYAIRTSTAQRKLAALLLKQGRDTKDDVTLRYVLYREAADLASRSGDLETLLGALEALSKGYQVDSLSLSVPFLAKAESATSAPEDLRKLAEALLGLTREALAQDQFEAASKLAQAVSGPAKKSKDLGLVIRAEGVAKSVQEMKSAWEKVRTADQTLKTAPDDPPANAARGEYLCYFKDQWEQGLVFLSKGPDPALRALAAKELAGPTEVAALLDVADGWWDLAGTEKSATRKSQLFLHARTFYERALPTATGLIRAKIEKRLGEVKAPPGGGGSSEHLREGLVAWWKCDEGKGATISDSIGTGNQGMLLGGVEWTTGALGTALQFNGSTGYVACRTGKLPAANAPQTISWWHFYAVNPTEFESIITLCDETAMSSIQPGWKNGRVVAWKFGGQILVSAPPPSTHAWHHFAYSFDGRKHRLYVDGSLSDSSDLPPQSAVPVKCELGRWVGGKQYFSGLLREVRIYSRPLSDAEIGGLAAGK